MTDAAKELGEGEGLLREALERARYRLQNAVTATKGTAEDAERRVAFKEYEAAVLAALSRRTPPAPEREGEFRLAVAWLVTCARTSGGVAGRDEGLCAALDKVEAHFPRPLKFKRSKEWWLKRIELEGDATIGAGVPEAPPALSPKAESAPSAGVPLGTDETAYRAWAEGHPERWEEEAQEAFKAGVASVAPTLLAERDLAREERQKYASECLRVWPLLKETEVALDAALAERDEARAERNRQAVVISGLNRIVTEAGNREIAALAELEEVKRALEPFATLADRLPSSARDHDMARDYPATPLVGDLRRARAALSALSSAKGGGMNELLWAGEVSGLKARIEALAAENAELRAERDAAKTAASSWFDNATAWLARADRAEVERDAALRECATYARQAGLAQGKLDGSEVAGAVEGWKERAEAAEAIAYAPGLWRCPKCNFQLLLLSTLCAEDGTVGPCAVPDEPCPSCATPLQRASYKDEAISRVETAERFWAEACAARAEAASLRQALANARGVEKDRSVDSAWVAGAQAGYRVGYKQALGPEGADPEALNRLLQSRVGALGRAALAAAPPQPLGGEER